MLIVFPIFRPHRRTRYVDAAYYYRPSSVVCLNVGHSVTAVSLAKTAEPIEMAFGILSGLSHLANTIGPSTCGGQWFIDVHPSLLVARWRGCLEIACSRSNLRCHLRTVFLPGFHHYANLLGPFSSSPSSVVYDLSSCTCQMSFSFLWFIGSLVA